MEELKFCRIDSYNVFVYIHERWNYIVDVDETQFNHVIEEAETAARVHDLDLITEIDINDFCDGVIYKNYKIDGRVFAYIQYRPIEDDEV